MKKTTVQHNMNMMIFYRTYFLIIASFIKIRQIMIESFKINGFFFFFHKEVLTEFVLWHNSHKSGNDSISEV